MPPDHLDFYQIWLRFSAVQQRAHLRLVHQSEVLLVTKSSKILALIYRIKKCCPWIECLSQAQTAWIWDWLRLYFEKLLATQKKTSIQIIVCELPAWSQKIIKHNVLRHQYFETSASEKIKKMFKWIWYHILDHAISSLLNRPLVLHVNVLRCVSVRIHQELFQLIECLEHDKHGSNWQNLSGSR